MLGYPLLVITTFSAISHWGFFFFNHCLAKTAQLKEQNILLLFPWNILSYLFIWRNLKQIILPQ